VEVVDGNGEVVFRVEECGINIVSFEEVFLADCIPLVCILVNCFWSQLYGAGDLLGLFAQWH